MEDCYMVDPQIIRGIERLTGERYDSKTNTWERPVVEDKEAKPFDFKEVLAGLRRPATEFSVWLEDYAEDHPITDEIDENDLVYTAEDMRAAFEEGELSGRHFREEEK
jgi:hypothetical protein